MNQSSEADRPYKGQKFSSFEHLKKYLEEYGQRNYVKFWIRSSHTRNSHKSKISRTMNPALKYVSVKFACIFGGEKIRCRGSGIRKSTTYRNLGCPCSINAVIGEDGNHVKLENVLLEHNHSLCKTLYDSLKKTKKKGQHLRNLKGTKKNKEDVSESLVKSDSSFVSEVEKLGLSESEEKLNAVGEMNSEDKEESDNCLKDIEDKYGKIVKILIINTDGKTEELNKDQKNDVLNMGTLVENEVGGIGEFSKICRLCLSSKVKLSPIFNPKSPLESTVLSFKIMGCASIEISSNDGLPNNICSTCEENLNVAYNFRVTCETSDSILRETYARRQNQAQDENLKNHIFNESSNEESLPQEVLMPYPNPKEMEEEKPPQPVENPTQGELYFQFAIYCPLCSCEFETYEAMLEHLGTHTDDETLLLACNMCTMVCPSVKDLHEHMEDHLKELKTEVHICGICNLSFGSEEELKAHESFHMESQVKDQVMGLRSKIIRSKHHIVAAKKQISVDNFLCNVCGKVFKTKDRFQAHRNMHEGLRPHVCVACGRGFADRKNLHQHYDVVHLRKVRHECPVCQRKFYTRTKMKSHMTMHSGDKPFSCDVCKKTFRLKMNMNKHKKTHTNDRPYQCTECGAAFLEKNLLKRHSYKHGGIRPYRCPACGHGFSARFCLKKHLKESRCRELVIADPDNYDWVGVKAEDTTNGGNCVIVYKTAEEGSAFQGDAAPIDLNVL